jgi:hypothetical protein
VLKCLARKIQIRLPNTPFSTFKTLRLWHNRGYHQLEFRSTYPSDELTDPFALSNRLRAFAAYYAQHLAERGDVYGWGVLRDGLEPEVQVLVDAEVDIATFPRQIVGIKLHLLRVQRPEDAFRSSAGAE